jgi:hypothetical protein
VNHIFFYKVLLQFSVHLLLHMMYRKHTGVIIRIINRSLFYVCNCMLSACRPHCAECVRTMSKIDQAWLYVAWLWQWTAELSHQCGQPRFDYFFICSYGRFIVVRKWLYVMTSNCCTTLPCASLHVINLGVILQKNLGQYGTTGHVGHVCVEY